MKELKIEVPQGYEIDTENSSFERIVFKKNSGGKTWEDLCNTEKIIKGFFISNIHGSVFKATPSKARNNTRNIFLTEKEAKSSRAAAMISQLMPYYGGAITDEEWLDGDITKYVITRYEGQSSLDITIFWYRFLAFHTEEQRDDFYNHNKKLIKEFLMLD